MEVNENIINVLRKIDLPTLIKLVGPVIINAIDSVHETKDETALANVLALKYGNLVLNSTEIRAAVINSLSVDEAVDLAVGSGISDINDYKVYNPLIAFFSRGYNSTKSRILVDFLALPGTYRYQQSSDTRLPKEAINVRFGQEMKLLSYLHPYQKRVKDEAMQRLNMKSEKSFFVQMPTGAGKTYTALECVVDLMRKPRGLDENHKPRPDKFIVWLVDRNELAEQALESFRKLWTMRGDHPINVFRLFKDFEPDFEHESGGVVFVGFDKLYAILKNHTHAAFSSIKYLIENSELLIVDEAHHSLAETYFACINQFRNVPFIKIMGLSATPGSSDVETTNKLVELYSADKISIRDEHWRPVSDAIAYLQKGGYLAHLKTLLLETGISTGERTEDTVLTTLASSSERNKKIIEQIQLANDNNEATIVFACTLDHVYALLILCRAFGINAKYIIGDIDQNDRIEILDQFKKKQYNILINLDILSTGIDLPNIQKVIIARPISSPNLLSQILGRALRGPQNGGNEQNTIINIKDNIINFPGTSFLYHYYEGEWEILK